VIERLIEIVARLQSSLSTKLILLLPVLNKLNATLHDRQIGKPCVRQPREKTVAATCAMYRGNTSESAQDELIHDLRRQRRAAPDIVRIRHERVNRQPVGLAGDDDLVKAARTVHA
jgi:hypothetical protein